MPPGTEGSDSDSGDWNVPGLVIESVSHFLDWVAKTGLQPVLDVLGNTVLSTPSDLTSNRQVTTVWATCLVVANSVFVLLIVAAGGVASAQETLQAQYGVKQLLPRIAVGAVAANTSLLICGKAIDAANGLTRAIAGQGVNGKTASHALNQDIQLALHSTNFLMSMLLLALLVMAIIVLLTFVGRLALLIMLIGVAPLALVCHALPQTEGIAYTWWRALAGCLGVQIAQAVVLLAAIRVLLTPAGPVLLGFPKSTRGWIGILVALVMLWFLAKIPFWMRHAVWGRAGGRGLIRQIVSTLFMIKTVGALAGVAGKSWVARRATTTAARSGAGPRRHPTGPKPRTSRANAGRTNGGGFSLKLTAFSDAPTPHTPMPFPVGNSRPPVFSSAPAPPSTVKAHRLTSGTRPLFSDTPAHQVSAPRPSTTPALPRFSDTPAAARPVSTLAGTPVPPSFSNAPKPPPTPKPAPKSVPARPPAPSRPVFSDPPKPTPPPGRGPRGGTGKKSPRKNGRS